VHGLYVNRVSFGTYVGHISIDWCKYHVSINQTSDINNKPAQIKISYLETESIASGHWTDDVAIIFDTNNYAFGTIDFVMIISGTSGSQPNGLTKIGGVNILCKPVGQSHYEWTTTGRPIQNAARKLEYFGWNITDSKLEYYNGSAWVQL
jgi:hypothetical protein